MFEHVGYRKYGIKSSFQQIFLPSCLLACFLQKLSYLLPSCLPACLLPFTCLPASFTCLPACFLLCLFSSSAFCFFLLANLLQNFSQCYMNRRHPIKMLDSLFMLTYILLLLTYACCLVFQKIFEISQMSVFDISLKSLEKALALVLRKCRWPSGTNVTTLEIKHLIRLNQKKSEMKEMQYFLRKMIKCNLRTHFI